MPEQSKFCTNCGNPLTVMVAGSSPIIPIPVATAAVVAPPSKRFEVKTLFKIVFYIITGIIILGGAGVLIVKGDYGLLFQTIVNWLLGVIFFFVDLGLVAGVIAGDNSVH